MEFSVPEQACLFNGDYLNLVYQESCELLKGLPNIENLLADVNHRYLSNFEFLNDLALSRSDVSMNAEIINRLFLLIKKYYQDISFYGTCTSQNVDVIRTFRENIIPVPHIMIVVNETNFCNFLLQSLLAGFYQRYDDFIKLTANLGTKTSDSWITPNT